jgi:hypothetical protein
MTPSASDSSTCAACPHVHNGINGLYCNLLGRYVEHSKHPPCNQEKIKAK